MYSLTIISYSYFNLQKDNQFYQFFHFDKSNEFEGPLLCMFSLYITYIMQVLGINFISKNINIQNISYGLDE